MTGRIKDFYHFLGVVLVCYFEIKQVHVMLSEQQSFKVELSKTWNIGGTYKKESALIKSTTYLVQMYI